MEYSSNQAFGNSDFNWLEAVVAGGTYPSSSKRVKTSSCPDTNVHAGKASATAPKSTAPAPKKVATAVTPSPQKAKRKARINPWPQWIANHYQHQNHLTGAQRSELHDMPICYTKIVWFVRHVEECSAGNCSKVFKSLRKLVEGKGIRCPNWQEGVLFRKDHALTSMIADLVSILKDYLTMEDQHGQDKGNGWVLKMPLRKMVRFQIHTFHVEIKKETFQVGPMPNVCGEIGCCCVGGGGSETWEPKLLKEIKAAKGKEEDDDENDDNDDDDSVELVKVVPNSK